MLMMVAVAEQEKEEKEGGNLSGDSKISAKISQAQVEFKESFG